MVTPRLVRRSPVPANERVTVTLPVDLAREIDRLEKNRSTFIPEAARHSRRCTVAPTRHPRTGRAGTVAHPARRAPVYLGCVSTCGRSAIYRKIGFADISQSWDIWR